MAKAPFVLIEILNFQLRHSCFHKLVADHEPLFDVVCFISSVQPVQVCCFVCIVVICRGQR